MLNYLDRDFFIMCEDIIIADINIKNNSYTVLNENLLPYDLKNWLQTSNSTTIDIIVENNKKAVISWLSNRIMSHKRDNAELLFSTLGIEPTSDRNVRANVALLLHASCLIDNYWTRFKDEDIKWDSVNLRNILLNEDFADITLHNKSMTIKGQMLTPEFAFGGSYPKGWRRYSDSSLWLHKASKLNNSAPQREVMCSNLLDKMNLSHCYYKLTYDEGTIVSACPIMTNDELSMIELDKIYNYCELTNIDIAVFLQNIDTNLVYKMIIADYLLANNDRALHQIGLYFDPKTTNLLRYCPLFDYNVSFTPKSLNNRNVDYPFTGKGLRDSAVEAMQRTDFHLEFPVLRSDFIDDKFYEEFMWRVNDLGIETRVNTVWKKYTQLYPVHTVEQEDSEFKHLHNLFHLVDSSNFYSKLEEYMLNIRKGLVKTL